MTAEACGRRLRMVIAVPVFAPGCDLKRTQPPDVLAGVDPLGKAGLQMQKTVDETLHMEAVEHSNRAEPEKTGPAKQEIAEAE